VPFAISLVCDNPSGDPVRALWEEAGRFEATPSMAALSYPPHLTLAVYESIEPEALAAAVDAIGAAVEAQAIPFEGIRCFDGPATVLWAAPKVSPALLRLHEAAHRTLAPAACHPHYRPGAWVPHCTVALAVPASNRTSARAWAAATTASFTVDFDVLSSVRFHPVAPIRERPLRPRG
jgi:2'-5' RNA ligase